METTANFSVENVIWAVDVFTDIQRTEELAAKNIAIFCQKVSVEPKIVPVNVFPGIHVDEYFPFAEEEIQNRLSQIKDLKFAPVKVIPENMIYPTSVDDKVLTLIDYAKSLQCDLIAVTTHAHQSASHYVIGSFTNELLAQSPIPLLILNPACELKSDFNRILCPMEGGEFDEGEAKLIGGIAEALDGQMTFFYHVQDQASRYFSAESPMWKILKMHQRRLEQNVESQRGKLREKISGKVSNYEITVAVDTLTFKESISQFVRSNGISLVLFGGLGSHLNKKISRNVIEHVMRNANCPVLVMK